MDPGGVKKEGSEGGGGHSVYDVPSDERHACFPENCPQRQAVESALERLKGLSLSLQEDTETVWNFVGKQAEETREKENALTEAKLQIQKLETELRTCQIRLSKFIPDYQLTDTAIKEEIIQLRENASNWAEDFPDAEHFKDSFVSAHSTFRFPIMIHALRTLCPRQAFAAQSEILMCVTWWSIWDLLFKPLVVAPSLDLQVLEELDRGISTLNPKKDAESIKLWKSDTLRAYTSDKRHQDYVRRECSRLTERLYEIFESFNFKSHYDRYHKYSRLEKQIITPAANLSIGLSCSPEKYRWRWYDDRDKFPDDKIFKKNLSQFNVMDISTHNRVRDRRFSHLPQNAVIGKLLLVMFPALYRRGQDEERDILIEKATILINVTAIPSKPMVEVVNRRLA